MNTNNAEIVVNQLCEWIEDDAGGYSTSCRNYFYSTEESPTDNKYKFCCFCGKTLTVNEYDKEEDDEDGESEDETTAPTET